MSYGTPDGVKSLTGVKPDDLGAADDAALNAILQGWLDWVGSAIDSRLDAPLVDGTDSEYDSIVGVAEMAVAAIVERAEQSRAIRITDVADFAERSFASLKLGDFLDLELGHFLDSKSTSVSMFLSMTDEELDADHVEGEEHHVSP